MKDELLELEETIKVANEDLDIAIARSRAALRAAEQKEHELRALNAKRADLLLEKNTAHIVEERYYAIGVHLYLIKKAIVDNNSKVYSYDAVQYSFAGKAYVRHEEFNAYHHFASETAKEVPAEKAKMWIDKMLSLEYDPAEARADMGMTL